MCIRDRSYNVQEVKSDEITRVKDANFVNSLNGKVAGVNINACLLYTSEEFADEKKIEKAEKQLFKRLAQEEAKRNKVRRSVSYTHLDVYKRQPAPVIFTPRSKSIKSYFFVSSQ